MSKFWAGYLFGRSSGDGPSIPPGVALAFLALLAFVGILYVLQGVFNAIADATQAHPIVSLLLVGALTAGIGELVGTNGKLDVSTKITGTGALVLCLFAVFWAVGAVSGAATFDSTSGGVQLVLGVLSLGIVGGFAYMLVALLQYQCQTMAGRATRAVSLVLFAWWAWISAFALPLSAIPFVDANLSLVVGTVATLTMGVIEA